MLHDILTGLPLIFTTWKGVCGAGLMLLVCLALPFAYRIHEKNLRLFVPGKSATLSPVTDLMMAFCIIGFAVIAYASLQSSVPASTTAMGEMVHTTIIAWIVVCCVAAAILGACLTAKPLKRTDAATK